MARKASEDLRSELEQVLAGWKAHGKPVPSRMQFVEDRLLVVEALDEKSGCSIDWMTQMVLARVARHGNQLLDASTVFYYRADRLCECHYNQVPDLLQRGVLAPHTQVLDITCVHRGSLDGLRTTMASSWLSRFLPLEVSE